VTYNDPGQTAMVRATLVKTLGVENVFDDERSMGSEDVGGFTLDNKIPLTFFWLGAMEPQKFVAAKAAGHLMPGMHTSRFQPDPLPTLETGVRTLTAVATSLMQ